MNNGVRTGQPFPGTLSTYDCLPSDATEAVDTNVDGHDAVALSRVSVEEILMTSPIVFHRQLQEGRLR
jgi:hypothetical protein